MGSERLVVEQEPDIYAACSRPECGTAAGCSCPRSRTPTPADLVAHVVALPADEAQALLVALLRAVPDVAVAAVDGCKVAGPWEQVKDTRRGGAEEWTRDAHDGRDVAEVYTTDWLRYWAASGHETAKFSGRAEAMAAADAALLADGWVLASGGSRG